MLGPCPRPLVSRPPSSTSAASSPSRPSAPPRPSAPSSARRRAGCSSSSSGPTTPTPTTPGTASSAARSPSREARDAILALGRAAGIDADPLRVFQKMGATAAACARRWSSARGGCARAGVRTALVTNNAREFRERWRALLPADELFEHVVDSSEVGVRKPDPAIFRIALARLGDPRPRAHALPRRLRGQRGRGARSLGLRALLVPADPAPDARRARRAPRGAMIRCGPP